VQRFVGAKLKCRILPRFGPYFVAQGWKQAAPTISVTMPKLITDRVQAIQAVMNRLVAIRRPSSEMSAQKLDASKCKFRCCPEPSCFGR
jgi:hypothetical protein